MFVHVHVERYPRHGANACGQAEAIPACVVRGFCLLAHQRQMGSRGRVGRIMASCSPAHTCQRLRETVQSPLASASLCQFTAVSSSWAPLPPPKVGRLMAELHRVTHAILQALHPLRRKLSPDPRGEGYKNKKNCPHNSDGVMHCATAFWIGRGLSAAQLCDAMQRGESGTVRCDCGSNSRGKH